jgi:phosphate transport system substrate-binding protein
MTMTVSKRIEGLCSGALAAMLGLGIACAGETQTSSTKEAAGAAAPAPAAAPASQAPAVDEAIPAYARASGVSGSLSSIGSDTLNNLMTFWAEGFKSFYPNIKIQVEGKGSSTAPPALIEGTAQLGPMSREMKSSEVDEFEKKFGYKPTRISVAIDALAVYVNKDNPLSKLTIPQVDAIFSKTLKCGHAEPIANWGGVGLTGPWAARPMSMYGRNSASGTYGYFKEEALCKGDFRDEVKEQPGSASVVQGVTEDVNGIGYSGIGYKTSGVKALALSKTADGPYHGTDRQTVLAGDYPLARHLYVYVNRAPNKPLDPLVRELLTYVLSREGQQIVVKDGYLALPAAEAAQELAKLR